MGEGTEQPRTGKEKVKNIQNARFIFGKYYSEKNITG
jgi:hypothetical protein